MLVNGSADRDTAAIGVSLAMLCYLAAAALGRPWVGWVGVPASSLVVIGSELLGLPWWIGVGAVGTALVVVGLVGGASLPALTAQTVGLLAYGGLAVASLLVDPRLGMVLAGAVLAAHAGWDVVLWRRNEVIPRSLAEFCILLDVPLGVGIVVLAVVN